MLQKNLWVTFLTFAFASGLSLMVIADDNSEPAIVAEEAVEPAVEETPTEEPSEVPEQTLLGEAELQILGAELQWTGIRFRKAYNSFSIVPGTWHKIGEEVNKGNAMEATLLAVFILPIDFALSRFYGNFAGSYQLGKAGDHLIAGSKVFPAEQTVLMETSGKSLKTSRTYGIFSNALFYGGLIGLLTHDYGSSNEEGESNSSPPYVAIGAIATSYGLKMLSAHYVGSAGVRLRNIANSPLANEPLKAMGEAGVELEGYEMFTYLGNGLTVLGITVAAAGSDNSTALKAGLVTAGVGWIISSPVAASGIKGAANKLQEVGDRLMFWQE